MAVDPVTVAKIAAAALSDEKVRKGLGWILVAILSPLILLIAVICSFASGGADHNNATVEACFYGASFSAEVPAEFRSYVSEMQSAFSSLDSAVASVNGQMEDGSLDSVRVKAIFYALCFGADIPATATANNVVGCFYTTEIRTRMVQVEQEDGTITEEEEEYTVAVPVSLERAYANLAGLLGYAVTADHRTNADHIYTMIAGVVGGDRSYSGEYERGTAYSVALDISGFTDPATKNATDLVAYAIHAWESGWGYVWGTYGNVLTDSLFDYKLEQYPDGVGNYEDFIEANWLGGRTTDCVGLIKGYGWLDPDTLTIGYATNGMPDYGANQMYRSATVSGTIDTIPEIPGLAVWCDGHIGVYIGNGEVIEAMGTKYGVVKTKLADRNWTHWLEIEYISYD
ncbi:MAG: hypothetical protein J6B95_05460 [Oscillospiraceae bacterium]|nr:hypothetical protein [Oscillospiraceae bacterium]